MNSKTDKILSISAMVVAVASIVVSVWQGVENRNHNRLAVVPRLDISYTTSANTFGFKVKNNGIGPAILSLRSINFDGKEIDWYDLNNLHSVRASLGFDAHLSFSILREFSTIPAGTEHVLFLFTSKKTDGMTAKKRIFDRIGFKMEYKSMYDETFTSLSSNYENVKSVKQ